jgi:hypothetical protein
VGVHLKELSGVDYRNILPSPPLAPFVAGGLDVLTDREVPLEDLWGRSARELEERLRSASGTRRRVAIVEHFLLARLAALFGDAFFQDAPRPAR